MQNISDQGARLRFLMGVVSFLISLGFIWYAKEHDLSREARVLLFVPLFMAMLGFIQAKKKHCIAVTACSLKSDPDSTALRKEAFWIVLKAILISVLLTTIFTRI